MSRKKKQEIKNIEFFGDFCFKIFYHLDGKQHELVYRPNPTLLELHKENKALWKHVMGPYGSGKSVGTIADALFRARKMPLNKLGVRQYKALVTRSTYPNLKNTTWQTWLAWFGELGQVTKNEQPPMTFKSVFNDGDGLIEFSAVFLSLERDDDIDKLKSLEVTDIIANEISEMNPVFFDHFMGRANRFPRRIDLVSGNYQGIIISDTNPPDDDSVLYSMFEIDKPEEYKIFKQPAGLIKNERGEWVDNCAAENMERNGFGLSNNYYINLAAGKSDEFIKVFCCGEYGIISSGKPVYTEYNDDLHSAEHLNYIPSLPLNFCWDYGLTPCCAVFQVGANGYINVIAEFVSNSIGLKNFLKTIKPQLNIMFENYQIGISVGDPAGTTRAQSDESTCMQILNESGFKTTPAYTNAIMQRVESVKQALSTIVDGGRPQLMISRNCKTLRKGFSGHYQMERVRNENKEQYKYEPKKNFYSHIHDALQYGVMTVLKGYHLSMNTKESIDEKRKQTLERLRSRNA